MVEMIVGTYGFLCWLLFKKFKIIPVNMWTVVTAILGGVLILVALLLFLTLYHPFSKDGRMYAYTTPIIPEVRGLVVNVPVEPNTMLEQGDVLFQIDPTTYALEVDRLEAALAEANLRVSQLAERLHAATVQVADAKALLAAAESELDTQARTEITQARAQLDQAVVARDLAEIEFKRNDELYRSGVVSLQQYDVFKKRYDSAIAEVRQLEAAVLQTEEALGGGSSRIQSAVEQVRLAESQEREIRLEMESESGGMNPEVRQILAELDQKRLDLDQTTVKAPASGFVTQIMLRPGQMAVSLPMFPTMIFVHAEDPELVASYPQNTVQYLEPGLEAELAFKMYPGRIFKAKVKSIAPITPEGQLLPSGQIRTVSAAGSTKIPVVFEYGEDVKELNLPIGTQVGVAVYTHHLHALSIVRKILIRIKSWENYMFALPGLGH